MSRTAPFIRRRICIIMFITLASLPAPSELPAGDPGGLIKETGASLRSTFPVAEGWSSEKLAHAMLYAHELGSSAVIVLHDGELVLEWGKTNLRMWSHSVRKSLLSALYGIGVQKGLIELETSLADLGLDDRPPVLSEQEKQATIRDLLQSRSGVYHEAAAEIRYMKRRRPSRGVFRPGEHWYYNNWDFNVLGTIFELQTNLPIGKAFKEWIADPVGMQDFREQDVHYNWEAVSLYPAYPLWVSARDLARFGQLYLQMGSWDDQQIVPEDWIHASTFPYSKVDKETGYGLMWWTHSSGAYYAHGFMGQFIVIIPHQELVIVNRVFTGTPAMRCLPEDMREELQPYTGLVGRTEMKRLVELIMDAMPGS